MPAPTKAPPARPAPLMTGSFGVRRGKKAAAHKTIIYGPGGVGKTELCSLIAQCDIEPLFLDLEDGSSHLDVARVEPSPRSIEDIETVLTNDDLMADFGAIVVDSLTKLEELCRSWVIRNVPHEKPGRQIKSIEDYGFGKGLVHVAESFEFVLGMLDHWYLQGKHVICVAHECVATVPNPAGEDWIRYEPRLQSPPSGKGSIRHRCKEWCDHLLFVGFDVAPDDRGKAIGSGTRTIYPTEMPSHWAKSRTLSDPMGYERGNGDLWKRMIG